MCIISRRTGFISAVRPRRRECKQPSRWPTCVFVLCHTANLHHIWVGLPSCDLSSSVAVSSLSLSHAKEVRQKIDPPYEQSGDDALHLHLGARFVQNTQLAYCSANEISALSISTPHVRLNGTHTTLAHSHRSRQSICTYRCCSQLQRSRYV
jgi:hypothetical protein